MDDENRLTALIGKQRHVDAIFGGKQVRFCITEGNKPNLFFCEFYPNALRTPYATMQRFALGTWSIEDLHQVLIAGMAGERAAERFIGARSTVAAVLSRNPPAIYVPLAIQVLEAFMFGIDPANSTFDEAARREAAA